MRLRLLVPRRGRGGSLRRLTPSRRAAAVAAALAAAIVAVVAAFVLTGQEPEPGPAPIATPGATPSPTAAPAPASLRGRLEVGLTEPNPAFLTGAGDPAFARWAAVVRDMRPAYYRLVVDWAAVTAPDGSGIDLARPQAGCMRDKGPCQGWAGVRAQLDALAAAQRALPGRLRGMVVITGTPEQLATPAGGCERTDVQPRSRPPRAGALPAYRELVRALLAEARRAGADVPYWSPWNEPNHPYFLSPQRASCSAAAQPVAPAPYARIAEAMLAELDAAAGDRRLVLGETAGLFERKPTTTPVPRFIRSLPRALVCRAAVYGQHGYIGGVDPVGAVVRALRSFGCPGGVPPIWITETGVKSHAPASCRAVLRRLKRWNRSPWVQAAFQYTLREDDLFPTGLVSTDLSRALPALGLWQALGERGVDGPLPGPSTCRAPAAR